jgi:BMFP domain-containing protein YqiC
MSDEGFVSIESAARTTGISARTLRYWISTGKRTATADKRVKRVSLADVERLGRMTGKVSSTAGTPMATVPTSAVAVSSAITPAIDVARMLERLDALYREQLDAKNALILHLEQRVSELEERQAATAVPATATTEQIDALQARLSALEAKQAESLTQASNAAQMATGEATGKPKKPRQQKWWLRLFGIDAE